MCGKDKYEGTGKDLSVKVVKVGREQKSTGSKQGGKRKREG